MNQDIKQGKIIDKEVTKYKQYQTTINKINRNTNMNMQVAYSKAAYGKLSENLNLKYIKKQKIPHPPPQDPVLLLPVSLLEAQWLIEPKNRI